MTIACEQDKVEINIQGEKIEETNQIKYLGAIMDVKGNLEKEISNRIRKVTAMYWALYNSFFNKREVSKRTKTKIHESVLVPMLIYGSESWVLSDNLKSKVEACEMKILRKIEGVSRMDKIKSEVVRERLKVKGVLDKIETQQLRWFGHIVRMDENRTAKVIWEMATGGKRKRGRPRKTWNNEIAKTLMKKGLNWTQAKHAAKDRKEWRRIITSTPTVEEVTG